MKREQILEKLHSQVKIAVSQANLTGKLLIVAVSGGPDSTALVHALHNVRKEVDFKMHGAHLDHQLRGNASKLDAQYVSDVFGSLGIESTVEHFNVGSLMEEEGLSMEVAARKARYRFLSRVAKRNGAAAIVLGHTMDDQVETVLMNIMRGSGLSGIAGMSTLGYGPLKHNKIQLLRPLLSVSREETALYCRIQGFSPRIDETNESLSLRRNRVRLELIPELEKYNPSVKKALFRLSRSASYANSFIESKVDLIWDEVIRHHNGALDINREAFHSLDPALKRHIIRRAIVEFKGDLQNLQQNHIEDVIRLIGSKTGNSIQLPGGLRLSVGYDTVSLYYEKAQYSSPPKIVHEGILNTHGKTRIGDWIIDTTVVDLMKFGPEIKENQRYEGHFDFDQVGERMWMRYRLPGDRFQPMGMKQTKKLQDFMVDAKIPRICRDSIPLLVSPKGILWVVGWRVSEWAKISADTRREIQIRFKQADI